MDLREKSRLATKAALGEVRTENGERRTARNHLVVVVLLRKPPINHEDRNHFSYRFVLILLQFFKKAFSQVIEINKLSIKPVSYLGRGLMLLA